eukprot:scaffold41745_cov18-Tisochrysis_lutea.AAC.1
MYGLCMCGVAIIVSAHFLFTGGAHEGCPDKDPAVRLEVLEAAGRAAVPYTSGGCACSVCGFAFLEVHGAALGSR